MSTSATDTPSARRFYPYRDCIKCEWPFTPTSADQMMCNLCHTEQVYRANGGTHTCHICASGFTPKTPRAKYCSTRCRNQAKIIAARPKRLAEKGRAKQTTNRYGVCDWCDTVFEAVQPRKRFCSAKCRYAHRDAERRKSSSAIDN